MRYIIFVIDGPGNPAGPDEMKDIDKFNEMLQANGHWITAAGIRGEGYAELIDNRNNKGEVVRASLVTSDQNYSGFWLIQADSDEVAHKLALEGSLACNRRVELRPYIQ